MDPASGWDRKAQCLTKSRNATCPGKTRALPFLTLLSTAPPTFADFQDHACQSPEGADSLAKGTILSMVESAQGGWICQVRTYNLCDRIPRAFPALHPRSRPSTPLCCPSLPQSLDPYVRLAPPTPTSESLARTLLRRLGRCPGC